MLSKFMLSSVLNVDKEVLDILFGNDKLEFFYVIREERVGEDQDKWYSIDRGLNRGFLNELYGEDNIT